jgi:hypothetical protein
MPKTSAESLRVTECFQKWNFQSCNGVTDGKYAIIQDRGHREFCTSNTRSNKTVDNYCQIKNIG